MDRYAALTLVAAAYERLPDDLRAAFDDRRNVDLEIKDRPTFWDRRRGIPRDTRGVFVQVDPRQLADDPDTDDAPPAAGKIILYLGNIKPCNVENVAGILAHEAAHALGLDEAQVEAMGL